MKRIAFLLDYLYAATFQHAVVNGLAAALPREKAELYVMIGGSIKRERFDPNITYRNKLYDLITRERFDGIVVSSTAHSQITNEETIEFLDRYQGIPIVLFGPGPEQYPQVTVENRQGMTELVRHFAVDHGYRRIAFAAGREDNKDSAERLQAYRRVLEEMGIPYDPRLVCFGSFDVRRGMEAVDTLLDERRVDFEAVIAANDALALGVKAGLEKRGYAIPSDVAIAGFDDSMDASCVIPSLTSVRQPYTALGRKVFEVIIDMIEGKDVPKIIRLPAELVLRQSCGCQAGGRHEKSLSYGNDGTAGAAAYFTVRRGELLERLRALLAPHGIEIAAVRIDEFFELIQKEIVREADGDSYAAIHKLIVASLSQDMRAELWPEVFSEIRQWCSPLLAAREEIERAERFFHNAHLVVSDIQTIQKNMNLLNSWKLTNQIGIVSEMLIGAIEPARLRGAIYKTFPFFNIRNFLFAEVIREENSEQAKLVALLKDGAGWEPGEEVAFPPYQLFPDSVSCFSSPVCFLLPVIYEGNYLGYVIFEKINNVQSFSSSEGWSLLHQKIEGLQPLYNSLTRDIAKSFYICRLITMRREAEESLKALARDLEFRNRELEDFAQIASHDLQEPLRKISFFGARLEKLIDGKIDADGLDYLARIRHAGARMDELIEGLLAYSRVTTLRQPATLVDPGSIIGEVIQDLEIRMGETRGTVTVKELPSLSADPLQMRQLFQNLIGNALKYHRPGVPPVVTVEAVVDGGWCEIAVADNGIGFNQESAERIFGIFQRLVGKDEYEGTGVGLAICKKIVEQHGGTISAHGEPGKGARFLIRMRRAG